MTNGDAPPTALDYWRGRVKLVLETDGDDIEVFLWDAYSTDNAYKAVGAGVLHLPAGRDIDATAAQLREVLARITQDYSVGLRLAQRDHTGKPRPGRVAFSESWDFYESPDYDHDDEYDGE